jgi:hypothetical protein
MIADEEMNKIENIFFLNYIKNIEIKKYRLIT